MVAAVAVAAVVAKNVRLFTVTSLEPLRSAVNPIRNPNSFVYFMPDRFQQLEFRRSSVDSRCS
jgi:hypothetical protein